jgi:hypothetical protein
VLEANPAACTRHGCRRAEFIGLLPDPSSMVARIQQIMEAAERGKK